jgi:hypothetical protein
LTGLPGMALPNRRVGGEVEGMQRAWAFVTTVASDGVLAERGAPA